MYELGRKIRRRWESVPMRDRGDVVVGGRVERMRSAV